MADGLKPKGSSVSRTDWTFYTLAAAMATGVTLVAMVAHLL